MNPCKEKYYDLVKNGIGGTIVSPLGNSELGIDMVLAWREAATDIYNRLTNRFKQASEEFSIPTDVQDFVSLVANRYCKSSNGLCIEDTLLNSTTPSLNSKPENLTLANKIIAFMQQAACALEALDPPAAIPIPPSLPPMPPAGPAYTPQSGTSPILVIGLIAIAAVFLLKK